MIVSCSTPCLPQWGELSKIFVRIGFAQQLDKLVLIAQPIVGRAHEPADPVCTLSGWVNGIASDETVGKGLAPDLREAAFGTA